MNAMLAIASLNLNNDIIKNMADFQNMADFPASPPPAAARDDCS